MQKTALKKAVTCDVWGDLLLSKLRTERHDFEEEVFDESDAEEQFTSQTCLVSKAFSIDLNSPNKDTENEVMLIEEGSQLQDHLSVAMIKKLGKEFKEAINASQFKNLLQKVTNAIISDDVIKCLFLKIDINGDGVVTWNEYLNFMLLESSVKDRMTALVSEPFNRQIYFVKTENHDVIVALFFIPFDMMEHEGMYCTVSKDGYVCFWNSDFKSKNLQRIDQAIDKVHVAKWALAAEFIWDAKMLVIAINDFSLVFFHFNYKEFYSTCRIKQLPASITCLNYAEDKNSRGYASYLSWGDENGGTGVIYFKKNPRETPIGKFNMDTQGVRNSTCPNFFYTDISHDRVEFTSSRYVAKVHARMVPQIEFIHKLHTFISCSKDTCTALHIGDIVQKPKNQRLYYIVDKGINVFKYSDKTDRLFTGGYDATIRIWNLLSEGAKLVGVLRGHISPIDHIAISEKLEIIVTVAENKEIRIYSLNSESCVQTIYRKALMRMGKRPLNVIFMHPTSQRILLASTSIAYIQSNDEANKHTILKSMTNYVSCLVYNDLYNQLITGDLKSQITVWDLFTGKKQSQFISHLAVERGVEEKVEITCMTLDSVKRQLLIGHKSGVVKIWDYNLGVQTSKLPVVYPTEITAVCWTPGRMFVAGWNGKIIMHLEVGEGDRYHELKPAHEADVTCMTAMPPLCIISISSDGVILLFDIKTCLPLLKYKISSPEMKPISNFYAPESQLSKTTAVRTSKNVERKLPDEVPAWMRADNCVEQIVVLSNRKISDETAVIFTCLNNGYVYCWPYSFHRQRLGYFFAAYAPGESTTSACTTNDNDFFITGDSLGYIKVWDITHYLNAETDQCNALIDSHRYDTWLKFPFVRIRNHIDNFDADATSNFPLHLKAKCFRKSIFKIPKTGDNSPHLINSFRGHVGSIISLKMAEIGQKKIIISASTDHSIRVYSITGLFMGVFNQHLNWMSIKDNMMKLADIPSFVNPRTDNQIKDKNKNNKILLVVPSDSEDDDQELEKLLEGMKVIVKPSDSSSHHIIPKRISLHEEILPVVEEKKVDEVVKTRFSKDNGDIELQSVDSGIPHLSESSTSSKEEEEDYFNVVEEIESDTNEDVTPSTYIPSDLKRTSSYTTMYVLETEANLRALSRWNKIRDAVVWIVNFLRSIKARDHKLFRLPGGKGRRVDMYSNRIKDVLDAHKEKIKRGVEIQGNAKLTEVEREALLLRPMTPLVSEVMGDAYVARTHYKSIKNVPLTSRYGNQIRPYEKIRLAETEKIEKAKIVNNAFTNKVTTGVEGISLPPIDLRCSSLVSKTNDDQHYRSLVEINAQLEALNMAGGKLERKKQQRLNGEYAGTFLLPTFHTTIPDTDRVKFDARCRPRKKDKVAKSKT